MAHSLLATPLFFVFFCFFQGTAELNATFPPSKKVGIPGQVYLNFDLKCSGVVLSSEPVMF